LLAAALTIPAAVTADAAPRKAAANTQPAAETTGVATPDAPSAQIPARRQARAAVGRSAAAPSTDAAVAGAQSAQSTIQVGNQCFRPTDSGRGYGYWTSCDQVYSYVLSRGLPMQSNDLLGQIERGADGGSGGGQ
jgi:hypothetical protein